MVCVEGIFNIRIFSETFINPSTNDFYKENDLLVNRKLAETLKTIAKEGADALYSRNGSFVEKIVKEIHDAGGIITVEDFATFEPRWGKPVETKLFDGQDIYTFPLPACGHMMKMMINILNGYKYQDHTFEELYEEKLVYHRLMEIFKYGFAQRSKLGDSMEPEVLAALKNLEDPKFADMIRERIDDDWTYNDFQHYFAENDLTDDRGTGHISIIAPNGDAVAITATINDV